MNDPPRPLRRQSTIPPIPPTLETRVALLEREEQDHREDIDGLANSLKSLTTTLAELSTAVDSLAGKVQAFSERRDWWLKVLSSIVAAGAVAIIGWAIRISWFVQSNHLPSINP